MQYWPRIGMVRGRFVSAGSAGGHIHDWGGDELIEDFPCGRSFQFRKFLFNPAAGLFKPARFRQWACGP